MLTFLPVMDLWVVTFGYLEPVFFFLICNLSVALAWAPYKEGEAPGAGRCGRATSAPARQANRAPARSFMEKPLNIK